MRAGPELRTDRLLLRRWREEDRQPFARLNDDPVVMEFFPGRLNREKSDELVDRIESDFEVQGYGLWAAEVPGIAPFIGFVGLNIAKFPAHFTPALEVGWRLDRAYWGYGYATEGGRAALGFAFDELGVDQVVSFTTVANERSRRVMERLGLRRDPRDDFEHPNLPEGHRMRSHVLYRINRSAWKSTA